MLGFLVSGIAFYSLIWLFAGFYSSLTLGLWMSGAYVLLFLLGRYLYLRYKRNWEWQQGAIMRKMEAIRLSQNPKPCYINEQSLKEAGERANQERRELAALTTRTWHK